MSKEHAGFPDLTDRRAAPRADIATRAHLDAIFTLARAAELHDEDTGNHVTRIRLLVQLIASRLGLPDAEAIGYDAMLHDVGKLAVPRDVLAKPRALNDREREVIEAHTTVGERLLCDRPSLRRAARIARSHHENWDGSGYPDGLAGEAIPLEARITAVADVFDALLFARAYKDAWSIDAALEEVRRLARTKLDPGIVAALCKCHDAGELHSVAD